MATVPRNRAGHEFTGRIASTIEARLGRPIDHQLASLGGLPWFDPIQGLNDDNACGGCHSPINGFGIPSRWPSASTITASQGRAERDRAISGGHRW
jgi:cytochrome c peroxidase